MFGPKVGATDEIDMIVGLYLSDRDEFEERIRSGIYSSRSTDEEVALLSYLSILALSEKTAADSLDRVVKFHRRCQTNRCQAYAHMATCRIPLIQEQAQDAIDHSLSSIHLLDSVEDPQLWTLMHQTAALCYYWMEDYIRAEEYVNVALDYAQRLESPHSIAAAYDLLANGWSGDDDVKADSFRQLYYQAIESIDDLEYTFAKLINQGFSLQERDLDDSARTYFQSAFDLARDSQDLKLE
ncbi:MAG: hypothetical protein AAFR14_11100, partial [Bacteroidota bacterium]